jgi:hypothetical protein
MTDIDQQYLKENSYSPGTEVYTTPYGDIRSADKGKMYYAMDIARGVRGGILKTVEGGGGLVLGVLEQLDVISDGSVEEFSRAFEGYYKDMPPETLPGQLVQAIGPYVFVGTAALKLFGAVLQGTKLARPIYKALLADTATVSVVSVPRDSNIVADVMELFGADRDKGIKFGDTTFGNSYFAKAVEAGLNYVAAPAKGDAEDVVLKQKLKNVLGDFPGAYAITKFFDVFRSAKREDYIKQRLVLNELLVESRKQKDIKYREVSEEDIVMEFPNANQFMTAESKMGARDAGGTPMVADDTAKVEANINE